MGVVVRKLAKIDKSLLAIPAVQPCGEEPTETRRESDRVYGSFHRFVADGFDCMLRGRMNRVTRQWHRCRGKVTGLHIHSVGSGGEDIDGEVPCCVQAHDELESKGEAWVKDRYGRDPREVFELILLRWQKYTGRTGAES